MDEWRKAFTRSSQLCSRKFLTVTVIDLFSVGGTIIGLFVIIGIEEQNFFAGAAKTAAAGIFLQAALYALQAFCNLPSSRA